MSMKKYRVPVEWICRAYIDITAESLEEAIRLFESIENKLSLPSKKEYLDGSFHIAETTEDMAPEEKAEAVKGIVNEKDATCGYENIYYDGTFFK